MSTDDFQGYASFFAGVIKAAAEFSWNAELQAPAVNVTVIGDVDTDKLRSTMAALAEQSLIINVAAAIAIPMGLDLNVEIDTRFDPDTVLAAVKKALTDPATGPLAPAQASIGGQFLASPLFETVQGVAGVVSLETASISILDQPAGLNFSQTQLQSNLGADHVVCVPEGGTFDFVGPQAVITAEKADVLGAASATTDKGC